jgi:20S proteasome alpha/beta subunit
MTLIVGIKCSNGIVLGADGAATLGVLGQNTAKQQVKKLRIIPDSVIVGVAGSVGMGQRIAGEIEALWEEKKFTSTTTKKPFQAMTVIRDALWKHISPEIEAAKVSVPLVGPQVASLSALCSTAVAMPVSQAPCLFQFDHQGSPEEATAALPFVSIGSGQAIADPFLAFIRRIFWPAVSPTLAQGIFAVLWTLTHAIATAPGGISEPIQIAVLEQSSGKWKARELAAEEQQEHREAIEFAESSLRKFRESFSKVQGEGEIQELPKP